MIKTIYKIKTSSRNEQRKTNEDFDIMDSKHDQYNIYYICSCCSEKNISGPFKCNEINENRMIEFECPCCKEKYKINIDEIPDGKETI